jgi:hypothetical protein
VFDDLVEIGLGQGRITPRLAGGLATGLATGLSARRSGRGSHDRPTTTNVPR